MGVGGVGGAGHSSGSHSSSSSANDNGMCTGSTGAGSDANGVCSDDSGMSSAAGTGSAGACSADNPGGCNDVSSGVCGGANQDGDWSTWGAADTAGARSSNPRSPGELAAVSPFEHGSLASCTMQARLDATQPTTNLSLGSRGLGVCELQGRLNELGFDAGKVDGKFGKQTAEAVRDFQRSQGLEVDGVVGPATRGALADPEAGDRAPGQVAGSSRYSASSPMDVAQVQGRLNELGFDCGKADGRVGGLTRGAVAGFQRSQGLAPDGVLGAKTLSALANPDLEGVARAHASRQAAAQRAADTPPGTQYAPNTERTVSLFEDAAKLANVPQAWASSPALHSILEKESRGLVGIPNYSYGKSVVADPSRWDAVKQDLLANNITATSSATGLGQLTVSNTDRYYPSGRAGIGDPLEEAVGMLSYIEDRYGSPEAALAHHQQHNWY